MHKVKFVLILGNSGQGNMGDYKEAPVCYFTTMEKAFTYLKSNEIDKDINRKVTDIDINKSLYYGPRSSGLGALTYRLEMYKEILTLVDPTDLITTPAHKTPR